MTQTDHLFLVRLLSIFALFDLALNYIQSHIDSLLKCVSLLLCQYISAGNVKCHKCHFVSLLIIFFKSQNHVASGWILGKAL